MRRPKWRNILRRNEYGESAGITVLDTREPIAGSVSIGGKIFHLSTPIQMMV